MSERKGEIGLFCVVQILFELGPRHGKPFTLHVFGEAANDAARVDQSSTHGQPQISNKSRPLRRLVKCPQLGSQQFVNLKRRDVGLAMVPRILRGHPATGEPQDREVFARIDLDLQTKRPHGAGFPNRIGKPASRYLRREIASACPTKNRVLGSDHVEDGAHWPCLGLDEIDILARGPFGLCQEFLPAYYRPDRQPRRGRKRGKGLPCLF